MSVLCQRIIHAELKILLAEFNILDAEEVDLFHVLDEVEEAILFQKTNYYLCVN
jgi:hypothetical protein